MASGHADWRPPGTGAGGRLWIWVATAAFPADIIASPGAGFRIVLFTVHLVGAGGTTFELHETTSAGGDVRRLFRQVFVAGDFIPTLFFDGVPFAPNNKLQNFLASGWGVGVAYSVEPI